ncbi:MAG: tetratricopeptide repeat protein [Microscillaceae bacterium]|nr:tetratricopeptide repeat protein [Microscillaceae bacterium]
MKYFGLLLFIFLWPGTQNLAFSQTGSRIERLENLLRLSKVDSSKVRYLHLLYEEYESASPLKAKRLAEEALALSEKNQYTEGIILSGNRIAQIYHQQGAYGKALEYYQLVLRSYQGIQDKDGQAEVLNQMGTNYALQDEYLQAIQHYRQSLILHQELKNAPGISRNLTNLGVAYSETNAHELAIDYHLRALQLADSLEDKSLIAYNLERLGKDYLLTNRNKEALRCFQQLLELSKSLEVGPRLRALEGLAQVFASQSDFKKAYEYYKEYTRAKESIFQKLQKEASKSIDSTRVVLDETRRIKDLQEEKLRLQEEKLQQRTFTFVVAIVLILAITLVFYRSNVQSKRANAKLREQQKIIEDKKQELENQKQKIESQNRSIQRKNITLEATFQEIERKNKDITASINYAKRIQESMLNRDRRIAEALPEHFVLYRPRDIVSGDFYWFTKLEHLILMAAVDCTGHGVPGAIMSMLGDSYLNQIINLQNITKPDRVLTELHRSIQLALNQEQNNNQDGMDIALCLIDQERKVLEFSGASRELFIIQDGIYEVIESNKLPIGGFQKERPREFTTQTFDISKPTWFYIYSDGFQDQFGGPRGRKFAKSRLYKTLYANYKKSMAEQNELLERTLIDWMGQNRQMDDIMVVGVKLG